MIRRAERPPSIIPVRPQMMDKNAWSVVEEVIDLRPCFQRGRESGLVGSESPISFI